MKIVKKVKKIKEDFAKDRIINPIGGSCSPSLDEIRDILKAKQNYELYGSNINWQREHFIECPRGIAWNVSPHGRAPSAEQAVKLYFLAAMLNWKDLVTELGKVIKFQYTIDKQILVPVAEYFEANAARIVNKINRVITSSTTYTLDLEEDLKEDIKKHDNLNPKLWNADNTLKDEVKDKINQIVEEFLKGLKEDDIKFKLDDIQLTGSNVSFNWTKNSDLDVHLLFDLSIYSDEEKQEMADLLYSYYTKNWKSKLTITIYDIPVELYIETNYEK